MKGLEKLLLYCAHIHITYCRIYHGGGDGGASRLERRRRLGGDVHTMRSQAAIHVAVAKATPAAKTAARRLGGDGGIRGGRCAAGAPATKVTPPPRAAPSRGPRLSE
eukprot:scaffold20513_cov62-Phaeocystis_antarctica.AAC.5